MSRSGKPKKCARYIQARTGAHYSTLLKDVVEIIDEVPNWVSRARLEYGGDFRECMYQLWLDRFEAGEADEVETG